MLRVFVKLLYREGALQVPSQSPYTEGASYTHVSLFTDMGGDSWSPYIQEALWSLGGFANMVEILESSLNNIKGALQRLCGVHVKSLGAFQSSYMKGASWSSHGGFMKPLGTSWGIHKVPRGFSGATQNLKVLQWGLTKPLGAFKIWYLPYKWKYCCFRCKIVYTQKSKYLCYYLCIGPDI